MKKTGKFLAGIILASAMALSACSSAAPATTAGGGTAAGTAAGTTAPAAAGAKKVALVLGVGGLGDQGYNDMVYAGVKKAKDELGIEFDAAEPKQISEFELILRDLAISGEYGVIISVGFDQVDGLTKVSAEFPDQQFAIIDGVIDAKNIASYTCKEEEGSFLVGALAGLMTKNAAAYNLTGKDQLGFVGALEIPLIVKFNVGYQAGAKYVNPNVAVQSAYVSGDSPFSDTSTAKEIALSQNNKGAGIIYHAAGGSGLGVFQAAAEGDFYAIGCNSNQNGIEPDHIVASMLKRVDTAAFNIAKAGILDKNLGVGTITVLGIKDDGVGYTLENSNVKVSAEDAKIVEDLYKKIAEGKLVVPTTEADIAKFLETNKFQ